MSRDDEDAALAHQHELEQEMLDNDPDYIKWLDKLEEQSRGHDQVR
jgi:hypothetical protein